MRAKRPEASGRCYGAHAVDFLFNSLHSNPAVILIGQLLAETLVFSRILAPMAQGHPVPTFPRTRGKEKPPSLAHSAGEGGEVWVSVSMLTARRTVARCNGQRALQVGAMK